MKRSRSGLLILPVFTQGGSGAPTPLVPSNGSITGPINNSLSINDTGFIGFIACSGATSCAGGSVDTVYTSNGTVLNTLATGVQWSFTQVLEGLNVAINNPGSVAFRAPSGNIIRADPNGTQTVIANVTAGYLSTGSVGSVNKLGTVAFTGTEADGLTGIFTGNGTTVTTIAHDGGIFGQVSGGGTNFPSINDSGTVAFAAINVPPNNGVYGVFTNDGTTAGTITTSNASAFQSPAINNNGIVAFIAGAPNGSSQAILVGAAGVAPQTVIQTGDALAGSTVVSLTMGSPRAINDLGQITFFATLANGGNGIFRADPSGGVGTLQNPILPSAIDGGVLIFPLPPCASHIIACSGGHFPYFDPTANVAGYNYSVDPTSSPFDGVLLPVGLGLGPNNNYYVLTLYDSYFKAYVPTLHVLTGGVPFYFAKAGLTNPHQFGILGVNPAASLDPANVKAFPTGLDFVAGPFVGNLQMAPVTYPTFVAGE